MAGTIKGITIEINGQTTKLQKAIDQAGGSTNKLKSELKQVEKGLKLDPSSVELLTQKQKILGETISATKNRLDVLKDAQKQMKDRLGDTAEGSEQYRRLKREILEAEKELKKLEGTQKGFNATIESMSGKLGKAAEATQKAGDAMKPISAAAGATSIVLGKLALDFEDAMAKVSTIADPAVKPISELKKEILSLSNETGVAATDVAESVYNAISAGQSTASAVDFVRTTNLLAVGGFTEMGKAVDVVTTTLNAYQMSTENATKVADILIQTQNLGKTSVDELSNSIGKVIPTANSMGVSFEQLGASFAILTANGINTAEATTSLNALFTELGKTGSKADKVLREQTGKSFSELSKEGKNLVEILGIVESGAESTGLKLGDMFGAVAAKAANTFDIQGIEKYNETLNSMVNAQGATEAAFEKMQTSSMKFKIALNKVKNAGIQVGEFFLPLVESVSEKVSKWAESFQGLSDGSKKVIAILLLVTTAIAPLLLFTSKMILAIQTVLTFLPALITGVKAVGAALAANPIGAVVAAIVLLIGYIHHLYETNEEFRIKVQEVWTTIKETIGSAIEGIINWVSGAWTTSIQLIQETLDVFKEKAGEVWSGVKEAVQQAIDLILFLCGGWVIELYNYTTANEEFKAKIGEVWEAIKDLISDSVDAIIFLCGGWIVELINLTSTNEEFKAKVNEAWGAIKSAIKGSIGNIIELIGTLIAKVREVSTAVYSTFSTLPGKLISAGADLVKGLWKGISDKTDWVINKIQGFTDSVLKKIKSFFGIQSPSKIMRDEVGKMLVAGIAVGIEQEQVKLNETIGEMSRQAIEKAKAEAENYSDIGKLYSEQMDKGLEEKGKESVKVISKIIDDSIRTIQDKNKKAKKEYEKAGQEIMTAYKAAIQNGIKGIQEDIGKEIQCITAEAQKQYDEILRSKDAMTKKLADFGDLYVVDPETNEIVIESIEKQTEAIQKYGDVLDRLKEKGATDDFLAEITKLGISEGTQFGSKLAGMTDERFKAYQESWTKKQELAKEVASKFYQDQLSTLEKDFVQKLDASLETVPALVENVGLNAVQGMIDGMDAKKGDAVRKARDIADAVIAEMQRAMDIHSPSRVMRDLIGKNIVKGIEVGIDSEAGNLAGRMKSLSHVIKNSVTTINNNDGGLHFNIGQVVNNDGRGIRDLMIEANYYSKQRNVFSK